MEAAACFVLQAVIFYLLTVFRGGVDGGMRPVLMIGVGALITRSALLVLDGKDDQIAPLNLMLGAIILALALYHLLKYRSS